ncbi:MAG: hypothetical protein BWX80_00541 [Candidatus Hydrogenedentes bacterium ADurb.Bin101]|nr:MAG: hypothetical protein BWX80_00541 [Candidatus Hydrogenedentes bacterium ADurb.Bin101]
MEKTADVETYAAAGDVITYVITVTNISDVPAANVVVNDPLTGLNETIAVLDAGASQVFTTTYTVQQTDVDAKSLYNKVTVTGEGPGSSTVETSDDVMVPATSSCCSSFDPLNPSNIFLGLLVLLTLLIFSLFTLGGAGILEKPSLSVDILGDK